MTILSIGRQSEAQRLRMTAKAKRLLPFFTKKKFSEVSKSSSVSPVSIFLFRSLKIILMQNHTKRSASDIRIATFKRTVAHNKVVKDEDMRKMLQCSVATYHREMQFYLQSMKGVTHDARFRVVGYESRIDELAVAEAKS